MLVVVAQIVPTRTDSKNVRVRAYNQAILGSSIREPRRADTSCWSTCSRRYFESELRTALLATSSTRMPPGTCAWRDLVRRHRWARVNPSRSSSIPERPRGRC